MRPSFIIGAGIGSLGYGLYAHCSAESMMAGFIFSLLISFVLNKFGVFGE